MDEFRFANRFLALYALCDLQLAVVLLASYPSLELFGHKAMNL